MRVVKALASFAHSGRTLAILTDDRAEVRVLFEAAKVAALDCPIEVVFALDAVEDMADVVVLLSRPGVRELGKFHAGDGDRTYPAVDPLLVARAVLPGGLVVQARDSLENLGKYDAFARALELAVRGRQCA